jgi:hypothetical protein
MRDSENSILAYTKSFSTIVASNRIAQHDTGSRLTRGRRRENADIQIVRRLAIYDGDIKRCAFRRLAIHYDTDAIIIRPDFAKHAGDDRHAGGLDRDSIIII